MNSKIIFYTFLLFLLLLGCDKSAIIDQSKPLQDGIWKSSDVKKFSVQISDTLQACNYYFNVRNSTNYPFSNLFLFVKTFYPNGKISIDTVECILANTQGKWLGKRKGHLVDNRIMFRKNFRFPLSGTYSFEFEQAMRTEQLTGIEDFGIRIEKFVKEE